MPDEHTLRANCDELLDQLQYTSDEVQALRSVITRVPEDLLTVVPEQGKPSIKAILGHIIIRDRQMARILASGSETTNGSELGEPEEDWNQAPTDELLSELQENRKSFVDDLRVIASRANEEVLTLLVGRLQRIVEQDVDAFREVATRLHSGGIGAR